MSKVNRLNVSRLKMFQHPVDRSSRSLGSYSRIVNANAIPRIGIQWGEELLNELDPHHFDTLLAAVAETYERGIVYPRWDDIFRAFHHSRFHETRVVLLGQDPYHGPGQAHGLCFSVPIGQAFPPTLRNIFKELQRDLGLAPPFSGDLTPWARQGVLLLNATLTVGAGEAGSHHGLGWERITDAAIARLSKTGRPGIVFMLWGTFAQKKEALIDAQRHHILKAPHPSPLSAYRGFIGCGHFSKANQLLTAQGDPPIDWSLP
jgi:uracil-DNA glycosylase